MKPILYSENATQFNTNGLGRLDCISCTVVEERNGEYTLEMEIAETALHASEITLSSIIAVKPSEGASIQAFRVYKITKPLGGKFTVYAQHISYQLSFIPTMPFTVTASSNACSQTLAQLKSNAVETCPFTFTTDVNTAASYNQSSPASIRSRLGGVEGSVLDQFGGEYEWDNYTVRLHKNRGRTIPNVSLRYGKNITDINQETNIENTITGIVPYWQSSDGDITVTLPEKVIEGEHASSFPFKRTTPMDFTQDFEEAPTTEQLRARAQHYVSASGIGIPAVSIKLSFIHLADTEEYKNLAAFQTVKLCDNVEVYFEKLGIATTAKIVRTEYDVLLERYNSVEIGSLRNTLSGVISSTEGAIAQVANDTRRLFKNFSKDVEGLIDNATSWLTSSDGYVMAVKNPDGSWKELLFLSTNDPNRIYTNANVLRVNENGIGFSSTGINGPYTQAWTLDGKMVIGGTNVPSLTVYDNNNRILFQIDKNGLQWNAPNSELNTSGTLTIKNGSGATLGTWGSSGLTMYDGNGTASANITGTWGTSGIDVKKGSIEGTALKVGTNNSTPGSIYVYDGNGTTSNNEIGHWDKDGISVKKGSIEGPSIKAGGDGSHSGNGGTITVYNASGTEIGHWNSSGISVKSGTIEGPSIAGSEIKVGGGTNQGKNGSLYVYNNSGTEIGHWNSSGISVTTGSIEGPSIKAGGDGSHAGKGGSITVYDASGTEIGHWNSSGISVKSGTIEGPAIKVGGDASHYGNGGSITVYDAYGSVIGRWDNEGINVTEGTIQGPSIIAGGLDNGDGTIVVNDASGTPVVTLNCDGVTVKDGSIEGTDIYGGTITGSTIQTARDGNRIVMNDTSSLMGYDGQTMHNLINMEQSISGTHQMTIDADTQLNIRTPNLYVTNETAGTGTAIVYKTITDTTQTWSEDTTYYMIKDLGKVEAGDSEDDTVEERWVVCVPEEEATPEYVFCTLPVYLKYTKTPLKYINGMLIGEGTATSVIV